MNKIREDRSTVVVAIVLTSLMMMANFLPAAVMADEAPGSENKVNAATVAELMEAVNDSDASVINLTSSTYQLAPQEDSSASYAFEGYLQPNRSIKFTSKDGAVIKNAKGKRHIYIMYRSGNVTLTFDNVTLKGNDGGGILYTSPGNRLTLNGADITGCTANDTDRASEVGGAVEVMGNIVLNDCRLTGNKAVETTSPYVTGKVGGDGGAVFSDGTITANDCTVKDNSGIAGKGVMKLGGAFCAKGGITINGGEYTGNSAPEGGVAAVKTPGDPAAKIVIKDAGLRGNSATNGGAVMNAVDLTATNVDFSNNTASGAGGAVNSRGDISTVITGCIFDGDKAANTTAGYGGAVSVFGGSLTIKDSSFTGDSAKYGGAASVDGDNDAIIENCIISDDSATNGGGIYSGHARLNIKNSVIESNNATKGGALYVYSNRKLALGVAIDGTSINGNSAKSTAGIYTDDINLIRANNSTFADNASDKGCQWSIANALADDPDYADALLHNANIVGTSYTSPYGNAYNNVDITYATDKYLGEDENPGGEDEDTSGEDEDTGDGDTTGPAVEPATPIIPDEPDGPIAPDIVPNTPAPSGGPSGSPSGALTPALTPASMPAGSSVVSNTVYTAAATPAVGTAPMSMNLSDGNAPDEAVIGNQSVPFESSRDGVWSLINLIMTVVAAIMMIVSLMATARRRYDSFEVEAGDAWAPAVAEHGDWFDYRAGIEKQNRKRKLMKLLCIIPTAIISVMFVLMEDMSKPMGYMDKWTSLFLVVLLVQVATTLHIIAQTRAVRDNR